MLWLFTQRPPPKVWIVNLAFLYEAWDGDYYTKDQLYVQLPGVFFKAQIVLTVIDQATDR